MLRYAITPGEYGRSCTPHPSGQPHAQPPEQTPISLDEAAVRPRDLRAALLAQVSRLAAESVDFIQLREKELPAAALAALARDLLALLQAAGSPTRLLLNGRPDIAAATRCHGVHLTSEPGGFTPAQVRALYAALRLPPPIISKACHTVSAIQQARLQQPGLILFSPIFGKQAPANAPAQALSPGTGLAALEAACALAHPIPVLALGGVTLGNAAQCLAAGAQGIAGIRLFRRP